MKTKLSVNINKIATLRNSRGENTPDVLKFAMDCERFGAHGITVHPRPDERHIRYSDVRALKPLLIGEFNIEGNPREQKFMDLVLEVKPHQVTLVPDELGQLTSNHGWNTSTHKEYLKETIAVFKKAGIRTSIFVNPDIEMIDGAQKTGADRIELYTKSYAHNYLKDREQAIKPFIYAAKRAKELGLEINAGHDLNLQNLCYFAQQVGYLAEVSIGHALISDAIYFGLIDTIQLYLKQLKGDRRMKYMRANNPIENKIKKERKERKEKKKEHRVYDLEGRRAKIIERLKEQKIIAKSKNKNNFNT